MIRLNIPGRGHLKLQFLVLDYNGTLALDGQLLFPLSQMLARLTDNLEIHVLTSDTFGTVAAQCQALPVQIKILSSDNHTGEKAAYVAQLGQEKVIAVGNGANDALMLDQAAIGIAVIGGEGCAARTIRHADLVVNRIEDAFELLLHPQRLVAGLRQ